MGTDPVDDLYQSLTETGTEVLLIGDARQPAKAYQAVHEAFAVALEV